jgi:hypothetical protein
LNENLALSPKRILGCLRRDVSANTKEYGNQRHENEDEIIAHFHLLYSFFTNELMNTGGNYPWKAIPPPPE